MLKIQWKLAGTRFWVCSHFYTYTFTFIFFFTFIFLRLFSLTTTIKFFLSFLKICKSKNLGFPEPYCLPGRKKEDFFQRLILEWIIGAQKDTKKDKIQMCFRNPYIFPCNLLHAPLCRWNMYMYQLKWVIRSLGLSVQLCGSKPVFRLFVFLFEMYNPVCTVKISWF